MNKTKKQELLIIRRNFEKKQRKVKIEQALKLDQLKLELLPVGSKEWCNIFASIELGKELLENGKY